MTTQMQLIANRLNGRLGGVKTVEGKAIACRNSLKHGLLASQINWWHGGDKEAFRLLLDELWDEFKPVSRSERILIETFAIFHWKHAQTFLSESVFKRPKSQKLAIRYEAHIMRQFFKTYHELMRLKLAKRGIPVPPPISLDIDFNDSTQGSFVGRQPLAEVFAERTQTRV